MQIQIKFYFALTLCNKVRFEQIITDQHSRTAKHTHGVDLQAKCSKHRISVFRKTYYINIHLRRTRHNKRCSLQSCSKFPSFHIKILRAQTELQLSSHNLKVVFVLFPAALRIYKMFYYSEIITLKELQILVSKWLSSTLTFMYSSLITCIVLAYKVDYLLT